MATIRITVNEDIERILDDLKGRYPALDSPELFKLGLSELYRNREIEDRRRWMDSLPVLELSDVEQRELEEALEEAEKAHRRVQTLEELKAELKAALDD